MKSYAAVVWGVAALALTTMVAPTVDAHGLRGSHDGAHDAHDAHEEHAPFFGYDLVPERAATAGDSSLDNEQMMVDPDYDASEVGREDDEDAEDESNDEDEEEEEEEKEDSEEGSEAMESDLTDGSDRGGSEDASETFGFDALERGGGLKNEAAQSVPAPMGTKPAPPPAVESTTTPPPIGESAAAAKDITSIDSSAIQQDPKSYGVTTTAPASTPPPIGKSAAAAKDITSIDSSAIQQDPKSYGVATTMPASTPLADSPMAAKPNSPTPEVTPLADSSMAAKPQTPTQTTAENSPKQRSNDVDDELDH